MNKSVEKWRRDKSSARRRNVGAVKKSAILQATAGWVHLLRDAGLIDIDLFLLRLVTMPACYNAAAGFPLSPSGPIRKTVQREQSIVTFGFRLTPSLLGVLCAFVCLIAPSIKADPLPGASIWEATVPVTAQTPDELKRAAAVGLADVLVGVSGRSEVVQLPAVRAALAGADRYVAQYRYERQSAPENTLVLKLKFAQAAVEGLLRSSTSVPATASRQAVILTAIGVETFADYAQLLAYLDRIPGVRAALPQSISGNVVGVQLRFDGAIEQLTRQLALDHRLLPEVAPVDASAANSTNPANATNPMHYRWQGG